MQCLKDPLRTEVVWNPYNLLLGDTGWKVPLFHLPLQIIDTSSNYTIRFLRHAPLPFFPGTRLNRLWFLSFSFTIEARNHWTVIPTFLTSSVPVPSNWGRVCCFQQYCNILSTFLNKCIDFSPFVRLRPDFWSNHKIIYRGYFLTPIYAVFCSRALVTYNSLWLF